MARRSRRRDNAGSSQLSYKKHRLLWQAAFGQAHAYRHTHPDDRCMIIDMTAGNGDGVPMPQLDFFEAAPSWPTPLLATQLAASLGNTDVILCEKDRTARLALATKFPGARILADHIRAPLYLEPTHRWVLAISDPCGYADQGVPVLQQLAARGRLDALIVFNEVALKRLMGMKHDSYPDEFADRVAAKRSTNGWMVEPENWAQILRMRHMTKSVLIKGSANFHYRIFVLAHTISDTLRYPTWEKVL